MRPTIRETALRRRHLTASLLVLLLVCAPLVGCSLGADQSGLDIPGFNPGATGSSDQANAQAALEYLSPDGEISDGRWVPGEMTTERWEALTDRDWGPAGLEELTAAMATVSTMRTDQDEQTAAKATWTVARSIEFAVDQVPIKDYTDAMKQNLAILLANCPDEIAGLASGGSLEGSSVYGLSGLVTDAQFETALYRIIDDEHAADTLVTAMLSYHHDQIDAEMPTATSPEATLLGLYQSAAQTMGYLDGIAELRADEAASDTINTDDMNRVLRAQGYVDAAKYGLLNEATIEAAVTGNNGGPFSFYDEVDGQPTITAPNPMTPDAAHEYIRWDQLVEDATMDDLDVEINTGHSLGYTSGHAAEVVR
ncbi:DUF6571 family protein [Actinomyces glycerinitolerans]|uniref:DUF6571 domain-containing protein n=1 Tax=Actinomyces glycerinitolerans TaxID=1892869 RepID=A0A1M4RX26_9ACTO|nr:DUF6571 family protein [Actinomyces glycerinitolerans]SHE24489.1 Hypothetical protein ACGLYG10_0693 [Actinomyces glycerinitolerans]